MNGISQKSLMYSILGAIMADRKSSSDEKLPRNELVKIGILNALEGANPTVKLLNAKLAADDKIKILTLEKEIETLKSKSAKNGGVAKQQTAIANFFQPATTNASAAPTPAAQTAVPKPAVAAKKASAKPPTPKP